MVLLQHENRPHQHKALPHNLIVLGTWYLVLRRVLGIFEGKRQDCNIGTTTVLPPNTVIVQSTVL
jgi:hypothetical protein